MTIDQIYEIYSGCSGVAIDSRKIEKGNLFFALKGEKFDANLFAEEALKKGASYAVVDKAGLPANDHFIFVENTLQTLQQLALMHRKKLKIPVIGVNGSNGKTTTKELLNRILGKKYKVFSTYGNYNNHIGLPYSIMQIDSSYEMAILEFGANHQNENKFLCGIALPDHGLLTNIGKDHLGGFGGFEGVVKAYSEFTGYFNDHPEYPFFLNDDDKIITGLVKSKNILSYGTNNTDVNVFGKPVKATFFVEANIEYSFNNNKNTTLTIRSHLFGGFNLQNILAAVCAGKYFKVDDDEIRDAVESYLPANNRSEIIKKDSNTYIFDAYNANPSSMRLAIESFAKLDMEHKVLVLGEMFELGEESLKEHLELINYLKEFKFDKIILVNKDFINASEQIVCDYFNDYHELKAWFSGTDFKNTTFLIKGSRGVMLEKGFGFYGNN